MPDDPIDVTYRYKESVEISGIWEHLPGLTGNAVAIDL